MIILSITISLKYDIVVTLTPLTQVFNSSKPVIEYFHIFRKKTINSLMIHSETKIHSWFTFIMFTNLIKTHPERILQIMMKWLINMCQHMEMNPLVIIVIWYKLLCFSNQIHLKLCWWIMQLHRWVALTIIWMLLHVTKLWGEMVLLHLFCTLPNVSLFVKQILLHQHLLLRHRWSHLFTVRFQGY